MARGNGESAGYTGDFHFSFTGAGMARLHYLADFSCFNSLIFLVSFRFLFYSLRIAEGHSLWIAGDTCTRY